VIAQLADDDNANIQNSYGYSPYGQSQTVGPDSANNPNQYTSRENDNTGLYYYRARYYDPVLKMFVSSDPIGLAGGMNTYLYANGSPLMYTDPLGLFVPLIIPGICAAGGCEAAGAVLTAGALWWANQNTYIKPPDNAYDPDGPKAPSRPTEADGFKPPKGGDNWVPNPNPGKGGSGYGWEDSKGDVWCPTGPPGPGSRAHGGSHWDIQSPGGGYRNKRPGQQ
jgi:RHS repeat-associated protein